MVYISNGGGDNKKELQKQEFTRNFENAILLALLEQNKISQNQYEQIAKKML